MDTGMRFNDGKIYMKGEDGKESELGVAKDITYAALEYGDKITYGFKNVLEGETTTISLPLTHKEWYKKRKGKRWVNYFVVKPGLNASLGEFLGYYCGHPVYYEPKNLKFGFSKKKPRGKRAKEFMRYIGFCRYWMKANYIDYTAYTKDCEEVEMKYPGDDTVYKYKVLKPEDNAKFEAIVTKRVDELKGEE